MRGRRYSRLGLFVCYLWVALCWPEVALGAQARLYDFWGQVRSSGDQREITGARISIDGSQARKQTNTDRQGRFRFRNLPAGTYQVQVIAFGYKTNITFVNLINFDLVDHRIILHPEKERALTKKAVAPTVSVRVAVIPGKAKKLFEKGRKELHENNRPGRSLTHFQEAIALYSDYDEAYVQLGIAHSLLNDDSNAVETFQRAVEVYAKNTRAFAFWGKHDYGQERYEEAVEHLSQAVELDDYSWLAHKDLSRALGKLGRREEALTHAKRAHDLYTGDPDVHLAYYNACVNQGDYSEGLAELDEFVKLFPKHSAVASMKKVRKKLAKAARKKN